MRVNWFAFDPSGVGHAFLGQSRVSMCGERRQPGLFEWPVSSQCVACRELLRRPHPTIPFLPGGAMAPER